MAARKKQCPLGYKADSTGYCRPAARKRKKKRAPRARY
jgi:hypothetical protein